MSARPTDEQMRSLIIEALARHTIPVSAGVLAVNVAEHWTGETYRHQMYEPAAKWASSRGITATRVRAALNDLLAAGQIATSESRGTYGVPRGTQQFMSLEVAAAIAARDAERVELNRRERMRRRAELIVLERHADEVNAEITNLLAKEATA